MDFVSKLLQIIGRVAPLTGLPMTSIIGRLSEIAGDWMAKAKQNSGMSDEELDAHTGVSLDSAERKALEDAAKGM
jgi:hypothetical protein